MRDLKKGDKVRITESNLKKGDKVRVTDKNGELLFGHENWNGHIVTVYEHKGRGLIIKEFRNDGSTDNAIPRDRVEKVVNLPENLFEI